MLTGPPATIPKKICVTASGLHKKAQSPVDIDNFNFEKGEFTAMKAYCLSKCLEIML